ncbi:MAG: hypothetical protein KDJ52_04295 [Anaerolineae bacterium]|nr:hypothetical protein [Anaerolineae bacterium]
MSSAALLLAPLSLPKPQQKGEYDLWHAKLDNLIDYRGGYRQIKRPSHGAKVSYLSNRGALDEFSFGEFLDDDLRGMLQICWIFGGDYLMLWSFGHSVTTLLMQSPAADHKPVIKEMNLRLETINSTPRDPATFDTLQSWFDNTTFTPDFEQLRRLYAAPELSIAGWFEAFGVQGASDLEDPAVSGMWDDFERVATTLLQGAKPEKALLGTVNKLLRSYEGNAGLPTKPVKQPGKTAGLVAEAKGNLAEIIGQPSTGLWPNRIRAAEFYWDITDCEGSLSKLTTWTGPHKKGLAHTAAFSRILVHHPAELLRDNIFLALAGLETEAANGDPSGFYCLADYSHRAGFSLAVFSLARQKELWQHFGLTLWVEPEEEDGLTASGQLWAAELWVDLPGILKTESAPAVKEWFVKAKVDGLILRAEADGTWHITQFQEGKVCTEPEADLPGGLIIDPHTITQAAKQLDPRSVFAALNLPDLLKPGEWQEGAYSGFRVSDDEETEREEARAMMVDLPDPIAINTLKQIQHYFPVTVRNPHPQISYLPGATAPSMAARLSSITSWPEFCRKLATAEEIDWAAFEQAIPESNSLTLRLTLPQADPDFQRKLLIDLRSSALFGESCKQWQAENVIWCYKPSYRRFSTPIRIAPLIRVLGDLPPGTRLALSFGRQKFHYELTTDRVTLLPVRTACFPDWPVFGRYFYNDYEDGLTFSSQFDGVQIDDLFVNGIVWRGQERLFLRVDNCDIPTKHQADVAKIRAGLIALGMTPLGRMACENSPAIIHGFAHETEPCYAVIFSRIDYGDPVMEFYTPLDHDQLVVTIGGGINPNYWWQKHHEQLAEQTKPGAQPKAIEATLVGLSQLMDQHLHQLPYQIRHEKL